MFVWVRRIRLDEVKNKNKNEVLLDTTYKKKKKRIKNKKKTLLRQDIKTSKLSFLVVIISFIFYPSFILRKTSRFIGII